MERHSAANKSVLVVYLDLEGFVNVLSGVYLGKARADNLSKSMVIWF